MRRASEGGLDARQHVGNDGDGRRVGDERRLELVRPGRGGRSSAVTITSACAAAAVGEGVGDVGRLRREGFDAGQPEARRRQLVADEDGAAHLSRPD